MFTLQFVKCAEVWSAISKWDVQACTGHCYLQHSVETRIAIIWVRQMDETAGICYSCLWGFYLRDKGLQKLLIFARSNVCSFRVGILESLTGRRSVDNTQLSKKQSLVDWGIEKEIKQTKLPSNDAGGKPPAAKRLCHHQNAKQPQPWTHDQRGSQLRGSLTIKLCNCSRWFFPSMYRDINRCWGDCRASRSGWLTTCWRCVGISIFGYNMSELSCQY